MALTVAVMVAVLAGSGVGTPAADLVFLGRFRVSYYWVAEEDARYQELERTEALRDPDGRVLARVSAAYRRALEMEGTGRIADGRVLNFAGRIGGECRFVATPLPWGFGVCDAPLVPFESVAADPGRVAPGSLLYIEEFAGFLTPQGGVQRGFFRADDVGSLIRGDRLDIFIGSQSELESVERLVAPTGGYVTVYRSVSGGSSP